MSGDTDGPGPRESLVSRLPDAVWHQTPALGWHHTPGMSVTVTHSTVSTHQCIDSSRYGDGLPTRR